MLLSAVLRRPVLTPGAASELGRVVDVVIDPRATAIVALCVDAAIPERVVRWADVTGFLQDAVVVRSADAVRSGEGRVAELLAGHRRMLNTPLVTADGRLVGRITNIEFDPRTGTVVNLITTKGPVRGAFLRAVGDHATVGGPERRFRGHGAVRLVETGELQHDKRRR